MYKAVISDLDGTLLNEKGKVSDFTRKTVRELIDKGITQCKGSEVPKLFTDLDGNFLTDVILVEVDNDNKSYYAYEEERFIYPIVAGGCDKEVGLINWVNDNKDKTFVFDIDIKEY